MAIPPYCALKCFYKRTRVESYIDVFFFFSPQERIKNFQEKRTAAEGSRRAKTAAKRSAQTALKRENKRKGVKARKKGREGAIAAVAAKAGGGANGSAQGGSRRGLQKSVGVRFERGGCQKSQAACLVIMGLFFVVLRWNREKG